MKNVNAILAVLLLISVAGAEAGTRPPPGPGEARSLVNVDKSGLALQGYDPVGYFRENKPVKGSPEHASVYKRATYHFASAENKALFDADPAKYEPQFGGYCGYAASINKVSPIGVEYFEIIDGRLILQHNQKALDLWQKDVSANLRKADANFPGLQEKYGS
jgi:YHS domain-containing protein